MRDQKGRGVGFWASKKPFDREYLENGKSACQLEINIVTNVRPLMRGRAAFVYHASTVDTVGRISSKC